MAPRIGGSSKKGKEQAIVVREENPIEQEPQFIKLTPINNNKVVARGGNTKFKIHSGGYCLEEEVSNSLPWTYFSNQNWLSFLKFKHPVYPDLVKYFYDHVEVFFNESFSSMDLRIHGKKKDQKVEFTSDDFHEEFGLPLNGFYDWRGNTWPSDLPSFEDVVFELNNGHSFPEGDKRGIPLAARTSFLNGNDKLSLKILLDCALCVHLKDSRIPNSIMVMLYYLKTNCQINLPSIIGSIIDETSNVAKFKHLPFGMLVSFIMKKWMVKEWGQPERCLPTPIGRKTLINMKLTFDDDHINLLAGWQRGEPFVFCEKEDAPAVPPTFRPPQRRAVWRDEMTGLRQGQKVLYDRQTAIMNSQNTLFSFLHAQGSQNGTSQDVLDILTRDGPLDANVPPFPPVPAFDEIGSWFEDPSAPGGSGGGDDPLSGE